MSALRLSGAAIAAAILLSACGSSAGLISQDSANTLHRDLENISNDFSSQNCSAAETALQTAQIDFASLPSNVNQRLESQLDSGLSTLRNDEQRQCQSSSSSSTTTTQTSTTGPTGTSGSTSSTTSSSTSTTTTTSTSTSTTYTSTTATGVSGPTGPTCEPTTGVGGGTPVCGDSPSSTGGIGAPGGGVGAGGTDNGAASAGN